MIQSSIVFAKIEKSNLATLFDACKVNNGSEIACGVNYSGGAKNYSDVEIKTTTDCTIRIPSSQAVTTQDIVEVIEFRGKTVSEKFKVNNINLGCGIKILKCQRIED